MSSLVSIITADGPIKLGTPNGADVLALQLALSQAGQRVGTDGVFGERTNLALRQFQMQHNLQPDGVLGIKTATLLDTPHQELVTQAKPLLVDIGKGQSWPHDDTASLIAFYGNPSAGLEAWKADNIATVSCPWDLYYEGKPWPHPVQFHRKGAFALKAAFDKIWALAGQNNHSAILTHVKNFSGSGEYRPIRGSSRLSCHSFWAAIDFDAEHLQLGKIYPSNLMPQEVVDAFKAVGFFWGGDFTGRRDSMHFQLAHE